MAGSDAPLLTREAIQTHDDKQVERVEVPEWGGAVLVKVMSGDEKLAWEKSCQIKKKGPKGWDYEPNEKVNIRVLLAVASCVDANGEALFTGGDAEWLGKKSGAALERVFTASCELNRIGKDDVEELEAEEKNS